MCQHMHCLDFAFWIFIFVVGAVGESLEQNIKTHCHFGYGVHRQRLCLAEPLAGLYISVWTKKNC